ncbi:MAG: hypothetical protein IE919_09020 [Thioclava sp.]|nr:hypothetical protein [Thioclava sp.]MBD3803371.1 hypothetical protein [Thioclava sp.]
MRNIRKISMIGATFLLAAATGHVMQTVGPSPALDTDYIAPMMPIADWQDRIAPRLPKPMLKPPIARVQLISQTVLRNPPSRNIVRDTGVGMIPTMASAMGDGFAMPRTLPQMNAPESPASPAPGFAEKGASLPDCSPAQLSADASGAGLLRVTLTAPCQRNSEIVLHDGKLMLEGRTDGRGNWSEMLPVLDAQAELTVFAHGERIARKSVSVAGIDRVNRAILISAQGDEMHLNAYENGAGFDEAGHVSIATPRTYDTPKGGYMAQFQTVDGKQVEIYTAPSDLTEVGLELDIALNEDNCGKTVTGSVWNVVGGRAHPETPLEIDLPSCPADGGAVVLSLPGFANQMAANAATQ